MGRISLGFDPRSRPTASVLLQSSAIPSPALIDAVIDTGSDSSILSRKDAEVLPVEIEKLPRSPRRVFGLTGHRDFRSIESAYLLLRTDEDRLKGFASSLLVNCTTARDETERKRIYSLPSILGVSLLQAHGLRLNIDWSGSRGYIEFD